MIPEPVRIIPDGECTVIPYLRVPEMSRKVVTSLPQLQRNDLVHDKIGRMGFSAMQRERVRRSRSGFAGGRFGNLKLKEISINYMTHTASRDEVCGP